MTRVRVFAIAAVLVAIWGCASPSPVPSNPRSPTPTAPSGPSLPPSADPSSPVPSVPASPIASPSGEPSPSAPQIPQDSVAQVVTNDLRVRSKPEVSQSSAKLEPLLDAPRLLFVMDGPVEASGYTWYEVAPIGDAGTTVELPIGWVAAADKDGTPWIQRVTPDCPPRPTTVKALWTVDAVLALACFGGTSITISARLAQPEATCGVDIGWTIEPDWLGSTCPQPRFLIESTTEVGLSINSIIDPSLDVSRWRPGVDPEDWIAVRITGRFDHPAASTCRGVSNGEPVPYSPDRVVLTCRATFVITKIATA